MIYEFRTYDIKPRTVDQFGENTKAKLDKRLEYSPLGGFWYTEMGPLNQVVHIWPYEDANHRSEIRSKAVSEGDWPPDNNDIILNMESEIMFPAPFMRPLEPKNMGPIYEMRIYTYKPGDMPKVLGAWGAAIEKREEYSPLVGCWYSDVGGLNKFIHMWSYDSFEERTRIRTETRAQGVWPPKGGVAPVKQENKILSPFDFSPLQ
jgi:hypothetical protein